MNLWDWRFALQILPDILRAAIITVEATMIGFVVAAAFGLFLAILRRSHNSVLSLLVACFIEFVRSTPLLVQIYFLYFVLPEIGIKIPALAAGILGLGIHYSTYCSEVYRSGLDTITRGQWEAAVALNLSLYRTYRDIIIPQAIPPVVPALGNYLISMFKETPILSAIAVIEMMQRAKIIGSETFRYNEAISIVGIIFLILSLVSTIWIREVEGWFQKRRMGVST